MGGEEEQIRFKERLVFRRNRLNLTQPALAELSGVSLGSISAYERGLSLPSFEHLQKLSKALGVNMGCLLGDELVQVPSALHEKPPDYMAGGLTGAIRRLRQAALDVEHEAGSDGWELVTAVPMLATRDGFTRTEKILLIYKRPASY